MSIKNQTRDIKLTYILILCLLFDSLLTQVPNFQKKMFNFISLAIFVILLLALAGFGNLRGNVELWDVSGSRRLISTIQASDSTMFQWCPDGIHFITATTAPRLRIGNGYSHHLILKRGMCCIRPK